jgi:hypothetical protein
MARFRILEDFAKLAPAPLGTFAQHILDCMTQNSALFLQPIVSMNVLSAQIDKYGALTTEAQDSRKAMSLRDGEGRILIGMLRQLGGYVLFVANDHEPTIASSGFNYTTTSRKQPAPRSAGIRKLVPGDTSGTMKLKAVDVDGASSYEVRLAVRQIDRSPLPNEYTVKQFSDTRKFLLITGLTPGTYYIFQVRALIGENYTDWSDSVTQMCL